MHELYEIPRASSFDERKSSIRSNVYINKIPIEKDDLFETRTSSLFLIDYILNSSWSWLQKLNIIKIVLNEIIRYSSVLYNLKLCYSWHEFRKKKDFENLKFSQLKNLSSRLTKPGHESIFKSSFIAPKQQTIDIIIQLTARPILYYCSDLGTSWRTK